MHKDVFACGREIKKRTTLWGLRTRVPPYVGPFWIPEASARIDDESLQQLALRGDDPNDAMAASFRAVPSFHVSAPIDASELMHVFEISGDEDSDDGDSSMALAKDGTRRLSRKRKRTMGCQVRSLWNETFFFL